MVQRERKAVIIASGLGRDMERNLPQPLIPLFGVPIIEHIIRRLNEYKFRVYVLYEDETLRKVLSERFPQITFIRDEEPSLSVADKICYVYRKMGDGFFLFYGNNYYGDEFFRSLKNVHDTATIFVSDKASSTQPLKIKVSDSFLHLGADLKEHDYFYANILFIPREILTKLCKEIQGNVDIEALLNRIIREGKVNFVMVKDFWVDIKGVEDLRYAERIIERKIVKNEDGYISRFINRRVSVKISKFLARYDVITPNIITVVSFLIGILAAFFFFISWPLFGSITTQIAAILDGCDGEIARIKRLATKYGAALDAVSDRYADILIILGMFSMLRITTLSLIALSLSITGVILFSYTWHMTRIRIKIGGRDVRLFLIMIGGLLGVFNILAIFSTLLVIGILTHGSVIAELIKAGLER